MLRRGFKSKAEKISIDFRKALGLMPSDCLDANLLANHLDVKVLPITDFPGSFYENLSDGVENCGWSALTMKIESGENIIIHNNTQSELRQQSNIMHELAHIICNHKLVESSKYGHLPFYMRHYDQTAETEAEQLGSILQIPRSGLIYHINGKKTEEEISSAFKASIKMVKFRINIAGLRNKYNQSLGLVV